MTSNTRYDKFFQIFNNHSDAIHIFNLLISLISIVTLILLIYGNRTRKPAYYWPYLIYMVSTLIGYTKSNKYTFLDCLFLHSRRVYCSFVSYCFSFILPSVTCRTQKGRINDDGRWIITWRPFCDCTLLYCLLFLLCNR